MGVLDQNQCVFVYEDDMWAIKGPYQVVIMEDEEVEWVVQDNDFVLRLLVISIEYLHSIFSYILIFIYLLDQLYQFTEFIQSHTFYLIF
jgi:hypothetical protein